MHPSSAITGRLNDLGEHLLDMNGQVRKAVAEAITETIARIARDIVGNLFSQETPTRPWRPRIYEDDHDPWDDLESEVESGRLQHQTGAIRHMLPNPSVVALAAALGAAGWWLRWHGSLPRALLVGVAALMVGGRGRIADVALELMALTGCVAAAGQSLIGTDPAASADRRRW